MTREQVLHIAEMDARQAYRDLSAYRVVVVLKADGWHVDYELAQSMMAGGGPHYVIDAATGVIVKKCYYQ
ncbi:MAG: hypothetical protein JNM56_34860 [Planctomycetia bacterium]|nr:hypothetical protein [Planctomycetia bacterium]